MSERWTTTEESDEILQDRDIIHTIHNAEIYNDYLEFIVEKAGYPTQDELLRLIRGNNL